MGGTMPIENHLTRSDLHARVWETPISRLAPELGLSDNGLRKVCIRHDIPIPPRGHWARLAAGHKIAPPKLLRPEDDAVVQLPTPRDLARTAEHERRASLTRRTMREAKASIDVASADLRPTLDGCHPLVRKTERFFAEAAAKIEQRIVEAQRRPFGEPRLNLIQVHRLINGRLAPDQSGCLRIVATLRSIDWILRFHDALIRALATHGCSVQTRDWNTSHIAEIHGSGERVGLSFAEEFETRSIKDPKQTWNDKEYIAKDAYKLKLERVFGAPKMWAGSQKRLSELLPEIARDIAALLAAQGKVRKVREAEEAVQKAEAERRAEASRAWFAAQKLFAEREAARQAQIDRAKAAGKAYDEFQTLRRLVADLEARVPNDEAAVHEWLGLVRIALTSDPLDQLLQEVRAEVARDEKPLWWPVPTAGSIPG
jgi:hypothetical protein